MSGIQVPRLRAAVDVGIQVLGRAINLVPGIVVTVLLTRSLGDDGFGQWSTVLAVVQIATPFGDFGLEQVAVRKAAAARHEERDWIGALITLRLAFALPVAIATAVAQLIVADNAEMAAAGLLLTGTLLLAPLGMTRVAFQTRVRNDLTILVLTVNSILWTAAVVAIVATDGGMVWFAAGFLASAVGSVGLGLWLGSRLSPPRLRGSRQLWRELARIGVPIGVAGLVVTAYVKLDQVMLFSLAGAEDAGLYGAVYRFLDQAQFVPAALMTTLFPIMSSSWPADPERVRRIGRLIADYLAIVSLPALGFTLVASEPVVHLLFGDDFLRAADALPILMGAFVVICFGYLAGNLVVVLELQRVFLRNALIALVFNVVLNLILIPPYGFVAAAWVTLATEVLVTALTLSAVLRRLELTLRLRRMLLATVAAALMTGAVAGLKALGAPLGVLLAGAAVSYPAAVLLVGAVRLEEIRQILQLRREGGTGTGAA
jgi:O-antigen/teichoic acid export membrane protein